MTNNKGTKMTLVELLKKYHVVIPIIQRDYAQGRIDKEGQGRYKEVRESFVDALYAAVVEGNDIVLDYIYGSDNAGRFLPIDGQQRLSTLFLLHWYIAAKADRLEEARTFLSKFTYEVRDSALEFCLALAENNMRIDSNPRESIKNAPWFYRVYENDPTIRAMLVMLDAIHEKFKDADANECWEGLTSAGSVQFWALTLEGFGLTDDLFIKMNARGKSLTRFETFKNEFESALDKTDDSQLRETWKDKVDNEWLDFFWERYAYKIAEDNMFRFILFISRSLSSKSGRFVPYTDLSTVRYQDDIKTVCSDNNLAFLVESLDRIGFFLNEDAFLNLHETFERVVGDSIKARELTFSDRAKLYAAFRYLYVFSGDISDYSNFERVINNLVVGQRRLQTNRKQYESSLDADNFGGFISAIEKLVDIAYSYGGILKALVSDIKIGEFGNLSHEINKAKYISPSGIIDQNKFDAVIELERSTKLVGLIHNILFDNILYLTSTKLNMLLNIKTSLLIRCVQSFSKELLLERKFNGDGKYIASGKVDDHYYNDEQYYYKWFLGVNDSDYGEYLFTNNNLNISQALKKFITSCSSLPFSDISAELEHLLSNQIDNLAVGSQSYYYAKYEEFYGSPSICACLIPLSNNYAVRILIKGASGTTNLLFGGHYNPFYMALKNLLAKRKSEVQINSNLIQTDKYIEEWHPLTLSNGVTMRLLSNGSWAVSLNNASISQIAQDIAVDNIIEVEEGEDLVEIAYDFISQM